MAMLRRFTESQWVLWRRNQRHPNSIDRPFVAGNHNGKDVLEHNMRLLQTLSQPRRQRRPPRLQITLQDGRPQVEGMGAWYSYWRDPYHLLLTIPWGGFLMLIAALYVAMNLLFALVYWLGGDGVANAQPGSFLDHFFFSVQTLATIGYGFMYPKTLFANLVVTIEVMVGIVSIAVLTGLAFARFSRSTARVVFSRVAVIAPHEGAPTLSFRAANKRRNRILEAQLRVYLLRDEVTAEGQHLRRIYDLNLLRSQTPSFTLSWSAFHVIDATSPFDGMSTEDLSRMNATIVISLSGLDETIAQIIHARHTYAAHEVLWNYRFADIMHHTANGNRYIDFALFHEVVPSTISGASVP